MKALLVSLVLLCSTTAHATVLDDDRVLLAQLDAGDGSAADPANGAPTPPVIALPPIESLDGLKARYDELREKYEAAKDANGTPRQLLFCAFGAACLKVLLDAANALAKHRWKQHLNWVALGLAVPIALLSRYAAGVGWFDAGLYALIGPGAIAANELLKRLRPKPAVA